MVGEQAEGGKRLKSCESLFFNFLIFFLKKNSVM